jgi:aromatic ring hydroxylase
MRETNEAGRGIISEYGLGHGASECMIVFDDVFVPWERVFMCGEWKFSRDITYAFATFHRLFGVSRMTTELEMLAGVAALVAEYNGIENYSHIRDKLAWLAMYAEAVSVIGKASCLYGEKTCRFSWSLIRFTMSAACSRTYHQAGKDGMTFAAALPTRSYFEDWNNPETRPWLEEYLAGKAGIPTGAQTPGHPSC